ncbi:pectinesterase [Fusarium circinatum]|uniref:pectinesterase n=1 Tax=Fusarium circinatum TaxID=48490 RepID=A0A8H5U4B0_FUSCI|nr:pectinesterase [Fusarium circinatum]
MARLSAWLLLPLVCGSSLAKEGSVVPAFVDSSSSHSTRFASLHDTPLNDNVPVAHGGSSQPQGGIGVGSPALTASGTSTTAASETASSGTVSAASKPETISTIGSVSLSEVSSTIEVTLTSGTSSGLASETSLSSADSNTHSSSTTVAANDASTSALSGADTASTDTNGAKSATAGSDTTTTSLTTVNPTTTDAVSASSVDPSAASDTTTGSASASSLESSAGSGSTTGSVTSDVDSTLASSVDSSVTSGIATGSTTTGETSASDNVASSSESSAGSGTTSGSATSDASTALTASFESSTTADTSSGSLAASETSTSGDLTSSSESSATLVFSETSETLTSSGTRTSEASHSLTTEFPSSFTSSQQTSESVVSTSTDSPLVLTVAADGSGDYTAINDAIKAAQTSGCPTVTVLAGTYTENVVIQATPTVTIIGEVSNKRDVSSTPKVVIDNGGNANPAVSFSTASAAGITWKNIKFSNTQAGGSGGAVSLRGSKNAFYNCQFYAAGIAAITGSYASAIVANSYIEAPDKVLYNYPSLYLYGTTVTATNSNGLIVYNKGGLSGSTLYNSTVVFDTCDISQKSGSTNTRVFLAAGNGDGSVAVFRDTSIGSFITATGVYVDAKTQSKLNSYIEFGTTGAGSYSNHVADRSQYMTLVTDPKDLSPYEISAFFKSVYPSVAVSSLDWIDQGVLSAIQASNAKDFKQDVETTTSAAPTTESATSTSDSKKTTSESLTKAADPVTTTSDALSKATSATSTTEESTSAAPTTSSCSLPSSVPSTAFVVGPKSNPCASYDTVASAIAALPADGTSQYVYILAGTYQGQVSVTRTGATVFRGETTDGSSPKNNKVTITASNAVLSSSSGSLGTATFSASKYEAKSVSFYNINFENSFNPTTNNIALAVYAKGTKVAFYGCDIDSSQGTLYLDYGNFFFSHSKISGTTDFLWGQGAGYIYNSVIVSRGSTTGQAIAAYKYQNQYGGGHVTIRGETSFENDFTQNEVLIWFKLGYSTGASRNEETPVLFWKTTSASAGLSLYNLNFTNTYPQTSDTAALAADFFGNMAAYGCAFDGFQDTLLVNQGIQVFSNSYISGSVDFIWGYSKAFFHGCYIASNTANAYITANNRKSSSWAGGFVFDKCKVTYTDSYGSNFGTTSLGRPWSQYALVVYMNSFLDKHISPQGWATWSSSNPQTSNVLFGEFNNTGPGNWTTSRASFATKLTESQAAAYSLGSFIGSTSWLDMKAYNLVPSYAIDGSDAATDPETDDTWPVHPSDGTTPPKDAVTVSVGGEKSGSYSTLTDALQSLPKDSTPQTIFIYAGTYEEQVPAINRPGPVTIIGYTESDPGKTYASNQVIITQAKGLSVAGTIPAGRSNADTATIATASTKIAFYNVKFVNSDNLDGATPSYVTLAASIYGNDIGFYGCSFIGWQATLLNGATNGYQYYESCYIEGAIDFIWGYSKAYFKGCTLGAKRAKSAITAQSRSSASAIGGYIFDQCLFTEAPSATVDLQGQVYLGRPYSAYALVVIKNSYLDSTIQPAGWKIWSTTDPRTDHITFAEYNNEGPGSWEKNTTAREAFGFATLLTSDTYSLESVMDSTDWIDMTYWDSITTPQPSTVTPTPVPTAPYSGKTPPAGAYIVSQDPIDGVTTYDTIQAAIDALPLSTKVTPTVFIYPGTYKEQIVLSRPGTTFFIGYSESPEDNSKNQVTITYDKGIDTQADASNSDSATFYATGNYFQAVNINFANTFGTTANYASLGFAVKSSKFASLYGCQVYGNQDALLINGNLFAYNSLFTGNIDMIWGSGAGYFLKSTIAPNRDGIALTANKQGSNTAGPWGFVFDQCTVSPAGGASYSSIYLGRPWDQYARVAYIESELGSCIAAAGWQAWTKADPRTANVIFGEFDNSGPGSATSQRASFSKQLTSEDVAQFELGTFFTSTAWINMTLVDATPFDAGIAATQTYSSTTVYTTQTVTTSQTALVTTTGADVTVTEKSTSTLDVGTTITPDPTTKTNTEKSTTTQTQQITQGDSVVTVKSTDVVDVGKTVTPADVTKTSTNVVAATVTSWITTSAKAVTTTVSTTAVTVTPKSVTQEETDFTTVFATKTSSPKAVTVKSTTTTTIGTGGTTTTSLKATTVVSTVVTTSVKTVSKTTTLKCIPTQDKRDLGAAAVLKPRAAIVFGNPSFDLSSGLTRRDLDLGSINLEARAEALRTVTVTVVSTYTTNVKTSTATVPGSTTTTELITTKTVGKTSTLEPVTVVEVSTSVATRFATVTIPGSTSTTTQVTTKESGKTTTLKADTTTVVVDATSVVTEKKTTTLPANTVTVYKTLTQTLAAGTVKVTSTNTVKKTSTVTLDQQTVTSWATVKSTLKPSSTVTERSTVSKVTTSVVKSTTTNWATKTSKGAAACTN